MRAVLIAVLLALLTAPAAEAAGWSTPRAFDAGVAEGAEPRPRAAVAADGRSVVAWAQASGRLAASFGDARGRFGRAVTVARSRRDFSVAAAPGGRAAIVYEASDGIHAAVRSGGRVRDRRVATSTGSEINGVTVAADPLGGWVLVERRFPRRGSGVPYRVRTLSLDPSGRPLGAVQDLGTGQFGIDARPTSALAVLPDGRALLVFQRDTRQGLGPQPVMLAERPHGGAFGEPVALAPDVALSDPRVTVAGDQALVGAIATSSCGDAGCAGRPRALRVGGDGSLLGPTLAHPNRAFAPWAVGNSLIFQLKDGVRPFSREASVRAVTLRADGTAGQLQTLTSELATEPVGLALPGGRVLALWATRSALGAALAGPDGRFRKAAAPPGPPPDRFHSNATNRDARAAGRHVIFTWARGSTVRVSVRAF